MPARDGYFGDLIESFGGGWNRFWFRPSGPLPCSVLRMAVGLLVVVHLLLLTVQLDRWYARDGLLPPESVRTLIVAGGESRYYHLSYFNYLGPIPTRAAHALAIALAAAFAAGLFTRITGLLTLTALLSYMHRLPLAPQHVEPVLAFLVAYLCIGPADAYFSVGRWLASRRSEAPPPATEPSLWATLSLRLIQVHLAAFVAMMALTKLNGDAWWDGEAVWYLLAQTHSRPLDLTFLRRSLGAPYFEYLINVWTHSVVYFELAFPVLIWIRPARPILLALGAAVWLPLVLATGLWLFALTLIVASLAFAQDETYRSLAGRSTALAPVPAR
jgi:hypothetical protein